MVPAAIPEIVSQKRSPDKSRWRGDDALMVDQANTPSIDTELTLD
jgi:hypothetical protein